MTSPLVVTFHSVSETHHLRMVFYFRIAQVLIENGRPRHHRTQQSVLGLILFIPTPVCPFEIAGTWWTSTLYNWVVDSMKRYRWDQVLDFSASIMNRWWVTLTSFYSGAQILELYRGTTLTFRGMYLHLRSTSAQMKWGQTPWVIHPSSDRLPIVLLHTHCFFKWGCFTSQLYQTALGPLRSSARQGLIPRVWHFPRDRVFQALSEEGPLSSRCVRGEGRVDVKPRRLGPAAPTLA